MRPSQSRKPRDERIGSRVTGRGEEQAPNSRIAAHATDEPLERVHHGRLVGEVVGMVHLDVRHDRRRGVIVQEVVAELVGLDHEGTPIARTDRCAPCRDEGPDLDGRVEPGGGEEMSEQRGRRRLAVRAGDPDADPVRLRHQLAEHRLPGADRDPPGLRGSQLGVVGDGMQRRGDRDPVHTGEMGRIVAHLPRNPRRLEGRRVGRGTVGVATIDLGAGPLQEERGTGRPGPRDSDDVDALSVLDHAGDSVTIRAARSIAARADARLFPSRSCGQVWRCTTGDPPRRAAAT